MRQLLLAPALLALVAFAACTQRDTLTAPPDPSTEATEAQSLAELAQRAQELGYVPGRVIVRFREGAPIAAITGAQGASPQRTMGLGTRLLAVPEGQERSIAEALARDPSVEFAEPDYFYTIDVPCGTGTCAGPNDGFFGYKWDLHNDGTITDEFGTDLASTGAVDADVDWLEMFAAAGPLPGTAVIGIIDTGIRASHEDLAGKVIAGYDFFDLDPDPSDDHGHGTHVAGIAAGNGNNGTGVPGVAFAPEVSVAAAKVCGFIFPGLHGCPSSAIADGIQWATDNGANVLNISLGGGSGSAAVQSALQYARQNGVLPFCAAGNDGGPVGFPAAFPECVAVSSTNWSDELASYSNFGAEIELAAPGGDFESPNSYSFVLSSYATADNAYAWLAGTSMASPQAAGLGGLLHALGVTDPDAKLTRMKSTANDLGDPGSDTSFGSGRINVYTAVADLIGAPPNQAPNTSFTVVCVDRTCDFTDTSTDGEGSVVAWSWDFGDGNSSTLQNPTHTYSADGTYTITLTATDDEGASAPSTIVLTVPTPNIPPTASFTSNCNGFTCDFTDASSDLDGAIVSWAWDFGDGNTSSTQSPSHTYATSGTFTVTLTVTDDDGDTDAGSANVSAAEPNDPPAASYVWSCTDLTCTFTDTSADSDGTVTTWLWNLGDGVSTNARHPVHTYGSAGTYAVTLTATDDDGATDSVTDTITVFAPGEAPTASFTQSCVDLTCTFSDTSTDDQGSVVAWSWDFGDGNSSASQNPTHTYGAAGAYTVTLVATDDVGATDSFSRTVIVPSGNQPPTASFTSSCGDLACTFTDTSVDGDGSVVAWSWDFGDGNTSSSQNPSHMYAAAGTYTVTLTATDDGGATDSSSSAITVVEPNDPPIASFTWNCSDTTCSFTDTSTDSDGIVQTHLWNFGDGWSSSGPDPVHVYGSPGTYTVTLTVTDDGGSTGSYNTSVTAPGPGEAPTASFTSSCTDLACDFTDTSTAGAGPIVGWSWDFGDGATSSVQHPSYAYAVGGTYTVTLVVTDDRGVTDTVTKSVTVPAPNQSPTASFTSSCSDLTCGFTDASGDGDGTVVGWSWDFGDGATSSAQSPSHSYTATGTYAVTLSVTDDDGATDSVTNSVSVIAPNLPPTAGFTWSCDGLVCSFTNTSIDSDGSIQNSVWAFGDGWSSNAQHPNHTYGDAGTFSVTVTVTDDDGATDSYSETIDVGERPVASFTSSCTGLDCAFTDASTDGDGTVVFWSWDFGDGVTSFAQNPSHSYAADGTYTVTLTVDDNDGVTDSYSASVTVLAANEAPTAAFSSSCTDLSCAFTDASSDSDGTIVSWSWDFGDGNTSTAQNPSHAFGAGGTYTVTLTVTDNDGATDSYGETVTVTAPNVAPNAAFSSSCTDLSCAFTDASSDSDGTIVSWSWDFGDGNTSTAQNPSHAFGAGGTYTVTLTVTDDDGATDVTTSSLSVTAPTVITLSVNGYKVRGRQRADLTWNGANSASVDVYRDGVVILTTPNDGFQTDNINNRGGGSYTYRVCEAGSSTCSQEVTITF